MPSYPGLGLDLRYHVQNEARRNPLIIYPMGIHGNCFGSDSEMLLIREVAMMTIMDRLSDKPDFHVKVFDDAITEKWIEEALDFSAKKMHEEIIKGSDVHGEIGWDGRKPLKSILDRGCLDYCIKELRAKAEYFKKTGLIPTLDACASMAKSDTVVDESLHNALRAAFCRLEEDQKDNPDWHPRTNEIVQDLVHPSMYPLVYGRTRVFADEVVGVENAIDKWAGKGDVIPQLEPEPEVKEYRHLYRNIGGSEVDPTFWSPKYQWLPANVKFQDDGSVKFTSYINNLHPVKYQDIYGTIEKLIEKSLPAWDLCLAQYRNYELEGGGRTKPRFPRPDNPDDENEENWTPRFDEMEMPPKKKKEGSEGSVSVSGSDVSEDESDEEEVEEEDEYGKHYYGTPEQVHWYKTREPVQPQAPEFEAWEYGVKPGASLREQFDGLQVIVKMASIEIGPGKPEFPPGGWHVEGQMNEHIVGTALYYLDSENVTPSHLQFRMQTSSYQDDWEVGQDAFGWMERVYGATLRGGSCLQSYGSVETKEGRLLTFPNVFQHRVSNFGLKDKTKPGHRRFIALWLVDPVTRIISTANVPPQQQSWWMEHTFDKLSKDDAEKVPPAIAQLVLEKAPGHPALEAAGKGKPGLPAELMGIVRKEFGDAVPMSLDEAKEHRLKLMDVRSVFQDDARGQWEAVEYSFCEH